MAVKEKCPYGCNNGRLFDTYLRKYVACPHCTGITAQLKEDAGNTEAKIELSMQLGIPEVYRGVRFDPKQFFEAKAMARFTTQSADRVLSKLSAIEARIAEANPIVESCYFRVGGNGSMLEYAYSCMQTAFSCGLNVVPFISLRELLIIRDRDVLLRPVHVDSLPKNIKENYYYSDFVKADVCFLMATAEVQQRELNVLTDLLMERARYGKGTYVFGCWLSTGRNMPDRLKAIIDPESRRLCLMHPYEVIERSLAQGNVDTSNLPAEYANVGDYGQEYNDPVDRFVQRDKAKAPAPMPVETEHMALGVTNDVEPVAPTAASSTKPVAPMAASSTKPAELTAASSTKSVAPTITNTTRHNTATVPKPDAPIAPAAPTAPAATKAAKAEDDNPFAATRRGKQRAGMAKEALQGIAQAVIKPKFTNNTADVIDDAAKAPSTPNTEQGITAPMPVDKAGVKADVKADVKVDTKADVKADTKTDTKADTKVDIQSTDKSKPKPVDKGKPKTTAKGKPKPAAKSKSESVDKNKPESVDKNKPETAKNAKEAKSKKEDTRTPEQIAAVKARMEKAWAGRRAQAAAVRQKKGIAEASEATAQVAVEDKKAIEPDVIETVAAPVVEDAAPVATSTAESVVTPAVEKDATSTVKQKGRSKVKPDSSKKAGTQKATKPPRHKLADMTEEERKEFYAERTRKSVEKRKSNFANMTDEERTAYYAKRAEKRRVTRKKKTVAPQETMMQETKVNTSHTQRKDKK